MCSRQSTFLNASGNCFDWGSEGIGHHNADLLNWIIT